jgi:hypothetical protein
MFSVSLHWRGRFCPDAAMPSRVGPRHAGQSVGEIVMGVAASADQARPTPAQAKIVNHVLLFIRVSVGSLAKTERRGKHVELNPGQVCRRNGLDSCNSVLIFMRVFRVFAGLRMMKPGGKSVKNQDIQDRSVKISVVKEEWFP